MNVGHHKTITYRGTLFSIYLHVHVHGCVLEVGDSFRYRYRYRVVFGSVLTVLSTLMSTVQVRMRTNVIDYKVNKN